MDYLKKFDLTGRVAVVTGAGRGIGLASAEALGQAGAQVILTDMDEARVERAAAGLAEAGRSVEAHRLNVTDSAAVQALHDAVLNRHGRIDILVNNAGIAISNVKAEDMPDEVWLKVLDVNLNGVFWCSRTFGRTMVAAGRGSIVNVGSMSGYIVNRPQEQAQYNASKAAVHHLTKSLAAEWATRGVRVNAVAPTYIETELLKPVLTDERLYGRWIDMTPMGRLGRPDEIASVILFLASDASSLMTGSIVEADAGYGCW